MVAARCEAIVGEFVNIIQHPGGQRWTDDVGRTSPWALWSNPGVDHKS